MKKITVRQSIIMISVLLFSPAVRLFPLYTTKYANEAAFLAPLAALPFMLLIIYAISKIFKKEYENMSLCEISSEILGKIPSKIVLSIYCIFLIIFLAFFSRQYSERLISTAYTNVDYRFFIAIMLIFCAYIVKKGPQVLARMSEVILPVIFGVFLLLCIAIIPMIDLKYMIPVTTTDFFPVIRSTAGYIGFLVLIVPLFFISDYFKDFKNIKAVTSKAMYIITTVSIFLIFICLGSLSKWLVLKAQYPFLSSVKQISILNVIEKMESIVVAMWIASDFVLISLLSIIIIRLLKYIFNIVKEEAYINIFMLFIFLLSLMVSKDSFTSNMVTTGLIMEWSMAFGVGLIFLLYSVMKIKEKIRVV